ncbi:GNAT family N-acetyltransferase [Paenibacillus stellifer]|uniref:GNAT family N-acetyltransferase n=1 Tax=Paenibacillus stellifer TaxID=169760 RepID=UPI000A038FE6|nr:GNAT family N-acetyltransferase [Paenibacillus stellifer]
MESFLKIAKAVPEDSLLISSIIQRSFKDQAVMLDISEEQFPHYVAFEHEPAARSRINGTQVNLLYLGEKAIGTVGLRASGNQGSIEHLAVLPEYRGSKYGEYLITEAEKSLSALGCTSVVLSIVAAFTGLRTFYERLGYRCRHVRTFATLPFEVQFLTKSLNRTLNSSSPNLSPSSPGPGTAPPPPRSGL